jgi:hypothetical protein
VDAARQPVLPEDLPDVFLLRPHEFERHDAVILAVDHEMRTEVLEGLAVMGRVDLFSHG